MVLVATLIAMGIGEVWELLLLAVVLLVITTYLFLDPHFGESASPGGQHDPLIASATHGDDNDATKTAEGYLKVLIVYLQTLQALVAAAPALTYATLRNT